MKHLFEKLRDDTLKWRKEGYPCQDYLLIGEVLRYQFEGEAGDRVHLKYLREPQFQSLENAPKKIQLRLPTNVEKAPPAFRSILTPDFTQRGASL